MKKLLVWIICVSLLLLSSPTNTILAVTAATSSSSVNSDDEIHMFICYGQSWSVGYDTNAITTTSRYDNLMLNTGIKNDPLNDLSVVATHFSNAVEQTGKSTNVAGAYQQKIGETPVSAQMNMVRQLMESENNTVVADLTYTMLGTAPGMGSMTLAQLEKGTVYYTRLIDQVQQAQNIAVNMNKRVVVNAFSWVQGSLGRTGNYAEALEQLRLDIDTDVKAITGQSETVYCITWQSFLYNKSLRAKQVYDQYVGAAETYPYIVCAGATYHLNNVRAANLHFTAVSQNWLGAYFGIAYKRTIIDGQKFEPLKPIGSHTEGNTLYVKFHVPYGSLTFDDTYFDDATNEVTNEGFRLFAADKREKHITDVSIVSTDTIKIVCDEPVESTDRLTYGDITADAYQWVNNNRGHLRDTQGDYLQYVTDPYEYYGSIDGNGPPYGYIPMPSQTLPLHNWCVIFDTKIDDLTYFEDIPSNLSGDADGNGKVNNRDLGLLQKYLNETEVDMNISAMDLDGNGKLNNRDLGQLQRLLNN